MNRWNVTLGVIGCIMFLTTGIIKSIVFRFDPGFHVDTEYPLYFHIFQLMMIIYAVVLFSIFIFNFAKFYKQRLLVIPRYNLFVVFSVYFLVAFLGLTLIGYYSSYNGNGKK